MTSGFLQSGPRTLTSLFLAAQIVAAVNGVAARSQAEQTDPRKLLEAIGEARQRIASGMIEFEVFTFFSTRPMDGTNHVRLKIAFEGEKRRCEQFGREYAYVLMGPDAAAVTDAKMREMKLDKEAAVRAGLLTGFESRYVTSYDGTRILKYSSANDAASIDDPTKGSSSYAFDPRVLGLTPSPSVRDTIEQCLAYGRAEIVQLVAQESVSEVAAWHVRVSDPGSSADFDFWIDASRPTHVLKCEFNGNTVVSEFDAAHPEDPIPIAIRAVYFYGPERARFELSLLRRGVQYNVPVDPASWTLAGLSMPVGTSVADSRISRSIGYWDGTGLSKDLPPNTAPASGNPPTPPNPTQLLALAGKDPKSLFALEAATWVILNTPDGPEVEQAADILVREHVRSAKLIPLCEGLERFRHRSTIRLLEAILKDNPDTNVQAHACFRLAMVLKDQANEAGDNQAARTATEFFERVAEHYGQVVESGGEKLADRAAAELFELGRLSVGKVAPEIEGVDLEGSNMKLSDHRGKVVVLSFWGTWCGPCMAMVPDERKLVAQMAGKPFAMIGVNSDHDESKLRSALEKEKITWPSFRDGPRGLIAEAWNVRSWPAVFVLDRQGVIRYRDVREQALFDAVAVLIREEE